MADTQTPVLSPLDEPAADGMAAPPTMAAAGRSEPHPSRASGAEAAPQPRDTVSIDQAQSLLRVLADPIRLQVVLALGQGERCVCDLTSELQLAQSKLSFHLRVMKDAGLITSRQQGRWIYYRLQPTVLLSLAGWVERLAASSQTPAAPCP